MDPYLGEIRIFAGNYAPTGWMMCQGQLLPISQYSALFSLIGTNYGGDGQNTFALPDFRGRVPLGIGSGFILGQIGGSETAALTVNNLPLHSHGGQVKCANRSDSESPEGNVPGTAILASNSGSRNKYVPASGETLADLSGSCSSIDAKGGSQPHPNMQPSLALNFIIAVEGIYPARD